MPDLWADLRNAIKAKDALRMKELSIQLAEDTKDLNVAHTTLMQLNSVEPHEPGRDLDEDERVMLKDSLRRFLDAWCVPRLGDSPLDVLYLVEFGNRLEIRPSSHVQRKLAESIVMLDKVAEPGLRLMLMWLAEFAESEALPEALQERVMDLACDPASDVKNNAENCLLACNELQTQARKGLMKWLLDLPRYHWPIRLLEKFPNDLTIEWRQLAERLRTTCDACLLGIESRCVRNIMPRPVVFIGHPYATQIRAPLRKAISDSLADATGMRVVYADQIQKDGSLSCKICQEIRSAKITLFDLTPECTKAFGRFCKRAKANPNVALELGLAYAYGKPTVLFAKTGCNPPIDLVGQVIEYFTSYPELFTKLSERVRGLI